MRPAPSRPARQGSDGERALETLMQWAGLPRPIPEYRFNDSRAWRFDFAWPDFKVAAEVEGGTWSNGRHSRGKGYEADLEKYNDATRRGWRVFRFTTEMVEDGRAIATLEDAIRHR